ncbi:hypothetical protein, variant 1 [Phytophthora nicotianae CJ01A1]|uniref:USP domain-containing protein n=2 Tax=Phytophthora nicotianae TaxID=4792 RepID=W2MPP2_PHYNI|nr:hypothetical protein, variant 1 [Phytophthora nicotianae]ETL31186.1 hypothetical protein, variant 1 [Phytophthora nicotianae]ETM37623.1 hypothetical protein, variant 1 [Phytophthora nicotianae]ETP07398.1 hypothetical protein, variant 1 [Phytophthora nicotianae CJ01A1]
MRCVRVSRKRRLPSWIRTVSWLKTPSESRICRVSSVLTTSSTQIISMWLCRRWLTCRPCETSFWPTRWAKSSPSSCYDSESCCVRCGVHTTSRTRCGSYNGFVMWLVADEVEILFSLTQISPHELVQEISVSSKKRFHVGTQNESVELLAWLLNELHRGLGGSHKPGSSIIHKCFQGFVEVTTNDETKAASADPTERESAVSTVVSPFLMMSLDLPSTPLFKDSQGGNIIPQIPLFTVLEKYNGSRVTHVLQGSHRLKKTYQIDSLPAFLIFHVKRFTRNNFFIEKNPTIVNFPVKNLELRDYLKLDQNLPTEEELREKSIPELRALLRKHNQSTEDCVEKADLVEKILRVTLPCTKYNLVANICHDSPVTTGQEAALQTNPLTEGSYRVHVQNRATEQWYEIQDLHVQETMPQLIGVSESYLMIYERKA